MRRDPSARMSAQAVGAYGEKVVESELLRRGWIPANVNACVKNAADFDIFALKAGRTVQIRVKTCGPAMAAFQFSFRPESEISILGLGDSDFTILVSMGVARQDDHFYIIPTRAVRETIAAYRVAYLAQAKRDGTSRKDTGHWTLNLRGLGTGEARVNYGLSTAWESYRENWASLEVAP